MADGDKTFDQSDVDRIVAERVAREKGKYADYDELKAKAGKLDEHEAANKSDLDKANARIAELERENVTVKAQVTRHEVAAEKGVKARWLSGSTREELEAAAEEYLKDHPAAAGAGNAEGSPGAGSGGGTGGAPGKPKEDLAGGGDPSNSTETVETNPAKLAESVPRL